MKRRAPFADDEDSSDESNGSNSAYEDIVGHSRRVTLQYGVTWELFTKGNSKDDRLQAFRKVKGVLLQPSLTNAAVPASALRCQATVAKWYIGVTFCPAHRWNEEPSPHKHKWDILYVLLLGRDMGRYEKNFLRTINHIPECKARCANVGAGGERCPQSSIKFLYLCVKYTAPPGGGWLQCLREPLDDNESEPEQPLALSDEQPLALSEQPLALSEQPLALSDEDRLWNTNSVEGCMLDEDRLRTRSAIILAVKMDKTSRVRAYTIDGVQCCLAGLGEKEQRLTFPMSYEVGAALWSKVWVRFAKEAEQALDGKWYKELEIKPKTLLHSNGAIANPEDFIGLMGTTVQVLAQERATDPNSGTSIPLMDLTGILTPASQSSRSDES